MYYFHFIPGSRRNNHFYCFFQTRLYTGLRSISTGFSGERRHGNGEYLFQVSQFDPGIYGPGIHMRTRRLAEADCRSTEPGPFSPNSPPSLSLPSPHHLPAGERPTGDTATFSNLGHFHFLSRAAQPRSTTIYSPFFSLAEKSKMCTGILLHSGMDKFC